MSVPEMSQANSQSKTIKNLLKQPVPSVAPSNRYIVAKVGDRLVTFPDVLVSEIIVLDRNAILALPFYETAIIGVTHHQANVMPLLLLRLLMGEQRNLITESLTVLRLSKITDELNKKNWGGVGVIVDRVIGSLTIDEYRELNLHSSDLNDLTPRSPTTVDYDLTNVIEPTKKTNQTVANIKETEYTPIEIILSSIPTQIWRPQRWQLFS
jgi:chemotaxis signal transduction protein